MSERMIVRQMMKADIPSAMQIKNDEGWNQVENDWKFLLDSSPELCLVAEIEGTLAGTITAINYENKIAWIGMMLVDKSYRRRGVSRLVLDSLLQRLENVETVKLDATVAGLPVYEKIGFSSEYTISRMILKSGSAPTRESPTFPANIATKEDIADIIEYDAMVFGANRGVLMEMIFRNNPGMCRISKEDGKLTGFSLAREGTFYKHIGPVLANDDLTDQVLITQCLNGVAGKPIIVDVVDSKKSLVSWLQSLGFVKRRAFIRMHYKTDNSDQIKNNQFCICGPEYG